MLAPDDPGSTSTPDGAEVEPSKVPSPFLVLAIILAVVGVVILVTRTDYLSDENQAWIAVKKYVTEMVEEYRAEHPEATWVELRLKKTGFVVVEPEKEVLIYYTGWASDGSRDDMKVSVRFDGEKWLVEHTWAQ